MTLINTLDKLQNELFLLVMINTYLMFKNKEKLNVFVVPSWIWTHNFKEVENNTHPSSPAFFKSFITMIFKG